MIFTREYKTNWNLFNKISFRFLFIYFTVYNITRYFSSLFEIPVNWLAKNVFSLTNELSINKNFGGGDTTYQYILVFLYFLTAILGTIIWSSIDYKRKSYNKLNYGFLTFLRVALVYYLLVYGLIKVFHLQMIPPTYDQLNQPLGEFSPMGFAWVFMGYSKGYSMFAGGAEVLAALFLIPRRTQTLGVIITIAVMLQVFVMNLCFDIPVKLFSLHLLLMSIVLFLNDIKRTYTFLFSSKAIKKNNVYPTRNKEGATLIPIVKIILLVGTYFFINSTIVKKSETYVSKLNPVLAGVWNVSSFKIVNAKDEYIYSDYERWKNLIISYENSMTVQLINDSLIYHEVKIDTINHKINFPNPNGNLMFNYTLENDTVLTLQGHYNSDPIKVILTRKTKNDFPLTSRKFRWINDGRNN